MVKTPLILVAWLGRVIGILLLVNALSDYAASRSFGRRSGFSLVTAVIGLVLTVLPMTASRLLFFLCGAAAALVGAVMLVTRLKGRRYLDEPEDPNLIDAL